MFIVDVNDAVLTLSGYRVKNEIIGKNVLEFVVPSDRERASKEIQELTIDEDIGTSEYTMMRRDGSKFNGEISADIIKNVDGNVTGFVSILRDITERKKVENTLKTSEKRYRTLLESITDAVFVFDRDWRLVLINDAAVNRGSRSKDKMLGRKIEDLFPNIQDSEFHRIHRHVMETRISATVFDEFTYPNGQKGWYEVHCYPVPEGILCISTDVTQRKQLEDELKDYSENLEQLVTKRTEELQMSEERLTQFMDSSPDGFFIFDSELNYVDINDMGMALFPKGTEKRDVIGKNIVEIALDIKESGRFFKYLEVLQTGKPFFVEDIVPHPTFGDVHLTLRAFKVGKHLGIITTDITERKQIEQQLLEAKRLAVIGETAGMVGHDLRNPLQAIVNTIYLAKMKVESLPSKLEEKGEVKAYLDTVERQVMYMNKIVSDLLDYARPIHLELIEISMLQFIHSTLLSMEIPETIEVSVAVPKKMKLEVDPSLMRRVFINLITNAVQAMPDGGKLRIKASKKADEVLISVKDTGVGIRKEDLPKLFQPLFTTKSKGQGFGLPVCKRIIDAHGGEILVKSKVGKGSTFTVKIPKQSREK